MNKEFVCVSQGIEIYRTKSQEDAINFVKKENDEWFDYCQRCADNYERPADNYVELYIEDDTNNINLKQALIDIRDITKGYMPTNQAVCMAMDEIEEIIDKVLGDE